VLRLVGLRAAWLVPQLLGISLVTFCLVRVIPANPAYLLAGPSPTDESIQAIIRDLGLDQPLYVQYADYLSRLTRGDLGRSWISRRPIVNELADRLPATLEHTLLSLVVALVLGVGIGVGSALAKGSLLDHLLRLLTLASLSLPRFWLGLLLVFVFYYLLRLAPPPVGRLGIGVAPPTHITGLYVVDSLLTGNFTTLQASLASLVLPVMATAFIIAAPVAKTARAAMIEILSADYVAHARACGLPTLQVWAYALRGALSPVVTQAGIVFSTALGGSVLIETVFGWPGIGSYSVQSVNNSDYNAVQGFVLLSAFLTVVVFLVVDLLYVLIDPRVRH
jgi:peptide/nickel transport system permease protein